MLKKLAEEGKPVIVYETDMLAGGLSSAILEWAADHQAALTIRRGWASATPMFRMDR